MKTPFAIWITDLHLSIDTIKVVSDCMMQVAEKCLSIENPVVIIGGDIFNSRSGQPQEVLTVFSNIIKKYSELGIKIIAIGGNHDKLQYTSEDSYLDPFSGFENFILVRDSFSVNISEFGLKLHFIPYFDEKLTYSNYLEKVVTENLELDKKNLLFTHIAINGVKNNDGSKVEGELSKNLFKHFNRVVVGHYHNRQAFDNVLYTGSAYQTNFGEDHQKGCSLIYSDGSIEFCKLDFPEYKTQKISLNDFNNYSIEDFKFEGKLRIKIEGKPDIAQSKKIQQLEQMGVKVECEYEVVTKIDSVEDVKSEFTDKDILDYFELWCGEESIEDKEFGLQLLK